MTSSGSSRCGSSPFGSSGHRDHDFMTHFPPASAADVVRASRRDSAEGAALARPAFEAAHSVLGPRFALAWQRELLLATGAIYYTATSLSKRLTLGEEYCDVFPAQVVPPSAGSLGLPRIYKAPSAKR